MEFQFIEPAQDFASAKPVLKAYHEDFRKRAAGLVELSRSVLEQGMTPESAQGCVGFYCQYCIANELHQQDEERFVFPLAITLSPDLKETITLLEQEHQQINRVWDSLAELLTEPEDVTDFDELHSLAVEFERLLNEHLQHEEQMLLPEISALFTEEQWAGIGAEMEKSRAE